MKTINLGTKNDAFTYAVLNDYNRYIKLSKDDLRFETPDAQIFFDSGVYPGITDVDQYMCDKASARREFASNGGSAKSNAKSFASRENGKKGGRPVINK